MHSTCLLVEVWPDNLAAAAWLAAAVGAAECGKWPPELLSNPYKRLWEQQFHCANPEQQSLPPRLVRSKGVLCLALQERTVHQHDDVPACLQPALAMLCTGSPHFWRCRPCRQCSPLNYHEHGLLCRHLSQELGHKVWACLWQPAATPAVIGSAGAPCTGAWR